MVWRGQVRTGQLYGGHLLLLALLHHLGRYLVGHSLGPAAPLEPELQAAPLYAGVEEGVQEQVGRPTLPEQPHHQELKLREGQGASLGL